MSLNGLDDVKVKEAHDAAVAELGGWFLLKYVSRDEVDVLGRGNGGIVEIRNAITQYEEESPLFGFLRYRRRNVLIKFVPEGCSRLVQARVTVHFNAVTEKFSPHDTVFSITSSKELRDSTLSAACSLHTASGSTSSSTSSLRRRRLMEIAEDENEDKRQSTVVEERPMTAKEPSIAGSQSQQAGSTSTSQPAKLESSTSYQSMASDGASLSPPGGSDNRPRSPTKSLDGRRQSSQSTRPDLYSYNSFGSNGRTKVKLGPRPSLDMGGRPQTSQSFGSYRPVSTLPPGLKLFSKGSKKTKNGRPQPPPLNPPPTMTISPPPLQGSDPSATQITTLIRPHTSGGRPNTSSGASMKAPLSPNSIAPKSPTLTPEKLRLMKALELRKKKMASAAQPELALPAQQETLDPRPVPEIRLPDEQTELDEGLLNLNDTAKADSGIAIELPSVDKVALSDTTRTNSTPDSPTEPSEEAQSTQASSISDSTDETVQEAPSSHQAKPQNDLKSVDVPSTEGKDNTLPGSNKIEEVESEIGRDIREQSLETSPPRTEYGDANEKEAQLPGLNEEVAKVQLEEPVLDSVILPEVEQDHDLSQEKEKTPVIEHDKVLTSSERDKTVSKSITDDGGETLTESTFSKGGSAAPELLNEGPRQDPFIKQPPQKAQSQSPPRELKIPTSKFSTQFREQKDASKAPEAPVPEAPIPEAPVHVAPASSAEAPNSPVGSTFSNDTKRSLMEDEQDEEMARQARKKRRGLVDPIRTDISTDRSGPTSETDLLSDDDLMDELQSATVEEAKPISVSKSPISPPFSNQTKTASNEGNRFSRAFSNPLRKDSSKAKLLTPQSRLTDAPRSVSASAAFLNQANQQASLPIAKKVNLGSGISQRIKALEKLSSSAGASTPPAGTAGPTPGSSPAFFAVGKSNSRAGSKSPSILQRGESLTRNTGSPTISRESSPEAVKLRDRSGSVQSRREAFNSTPTTQKPRSRPESISVTARIVRDPSQQFPQKPEIGRDPLDFSPLDLHKSPLVIDHQKAIVAPSSSQKETIHERRLSNTPKEVKKERRSSLSIVKDLINERRSSFAERRKSISIEPTAPSSTRSSSRPPSTHTNSPNATRPMSVSSRRSSTSRDHSASMSPHGVPQSPYSPATVDDATDKKSGRASRMLRLMSASLSASRKTLAHAISPTVREESEPPLASMASSQFSALPSASAITVEIGDVNVQFPDNLLWKRRSMSLDSQGFLLLSQAQSNKGMEKNTAAKKYHLSEFRTPFMPEMEAQELPNSVVLDFLEGGGLQVACEDRSGQIRVLQFLLEAHQQYSVYGQ